MSDKETTMPDLSNAVQAVKDFSWWNYGLDEVSETQSDDWAHALVDEIAPLIIAAHITSSSSAGGTTPDNLPTWVINLVAGLVEYEDLHPTLHAQYAGSTRWQKADCPGTLLDKIPAEVRTFAAGWHAARRVAETRAQEETADAH